MSQHKKRFKVRKSRKQDCDRRLKRSSNREIDGLVESLYPSGGVYGMWRLHWHFCYNTLKHEAYLKKT